MCDAYEQHVRWVEYTRMMQDLELGIPTQQTELDLPQSDMVRINDMAPVLRAAGNGVELARMNFSFPPGRPKGGPVFNFRSECRDFSNRFTLTGAPFLAIAGLWREAEGNHPVSFTMLTTSPGPDIAPCHDRQVVVLRPDDWAAWLYLTKPQAELLRPAAGRLARRRDGPRGQAMNWCAAVPGEGRFGLFSSAGFRHVPWHERRPLR